MPDSDTNIDPRTDTRTDTNIDPRADTRTDTRTEAIIANAVDRFTRERRNCAEMTFLGGAQVFDSEFDADLIRLATPFGGGIGGREDVCGALLGGCMAIGHFLGRGDTSASGGRCREVTGAYYDWFNERMGFVRCADKTCGTHGLGANDRCTPVVEDAIRGLVEMLSGVGVSRR